MIGLVRELLIRALTEDRGHFTDVFQRAVAKAFKQKPATCTKKVRRDYLVLRSRICQPHPTANWLWIIPGALDAAFAANHEECAARLCLGTICGEQVSLDAGSLIACWRRNLRTRTSAVIRPRRFGSCQCLRPRILIGSM